LSTLASLVSGFRDLKDILSGNVGVMALTWFLYGLSGALVQPFFTIYAKELGADDFSIALVRSIGMLLLALSAIFGGFLTDAIGRVKTIIIGTTMITVIQYCYAFVLSWSQLALLWIIDQAAHFYQPALMAIVMDSLSRDKALRGFVVLNAFPAIPWLFMPVIGGLLYDAYGLMGIRAGFIFSGTISTIALTLRVKWLQETAPRKGRRGLGVLSSLRELVQHKPVVINALKIYAYTSILAPLATAVSQVYGAIYVVEKLGVSKRDWGVVNSLSTLASIMSSTLLASMRSLDERVVLIIGGSTLASSQFLLALASYAGELKFTVIGLAVVAGSISGALLGPLISTMLARITPPEIRGRLTGIQRMMETSGSALASIVAGYLYTGMGAVNSLILSGLVSLVALSYLLHLYRSLLYRSVALRI